MVLYLILKYVNVWPKDKINWPKIKLTGPKIKLTGPKIKLTGPKINWPEDWPKDVYSKWD